MAKKFGLGKGLDALLPLGDVERSDFPKSAGDIMLEIDKIAPNPGQPRKFFDEEALEELAASIREHGVLQPIIVEENKDSLLIANVQGSYTIIAG